MSQTPTAAPAEPSIARHQFASDNTAGACPEALQAIVAANAGFQPSYGTDELTRRACDRIRQVLDAPQADVYFVFNGTAANSLALAAMCQSYQSVVCTDAAHVETDECGAPEFFSNGSKLLLAPHADGKLTPEALREIVQRRTDIHYPRARVASITQCTEVGSVYTPDEVAAVCRTAHDLGLSVHMDGARFANAVAALGCEPADTSWRAGVDVLCFGGAKMGLPLGEAVVFFDKAKSEDFAYRCKQAGQLASKMRFLAAPWLSILEGGAWLQHARHAHAMAQRLGQGLAAVPGVELMRPVSANGVFARLPEPVAQRLREQGWSFYTFIGGGARFMCSWATTAMAVDALVAAAGGLQARH